MREDPIDKMVELLVSKDVLVVHPKDNSNRNSNGIKNLVAVDVDPDLNNICTVNLFIF